MNTDKRNLIVLAVLDGWGIAPPGKGNVISLAKKPSYDSFLKDYPNSKLSASGTAVGLKDSEPGNSEAGHENLGAGRRIEQDKVMISASIHDGSFFKNAAFVEALGHARKNKGAVHLMGLLSDERSGHAEPEHIEALLLFFKQNKFERVYLHLFTDGRDTPPRSAQNFLKRLNLSIASIGVGMIATLAGRYYAMDRAHNYARLWRAYEAIVYRRGRTAKTAYQAVEIAYEHGESDEFMLPTVVLQETSAGGLKQPAVKEGDAIIFFNLRSDRARELTRAFLQPETMNDEGAVSGTFKKYHNIFFATMTEYGVDLPALIAYPTRQVTNCLPNYLEKYNDIHQFYISESEKFAHVTYFFHGNTIRPFRNEKRMRIDSKNVATFDLVPEMSANEITDSLVEHIRKGLYNFCLVNYPNADMLGHTGDMKATIKAVETIDRQLKKLSEEVLSHGGSLIITGDHGNAEQMIDPITGEPQQEHTNNPVPFILIDDRLKHAGSVLADGTLADVAPTILRLMGLPQPKEMLGKPLLPDIYV